MVDEAAEGDAEDAEDAEDAAEDPVAEECDSGNCAMQISSGTPTSNFVEMHAEVRKSWNMTRRSCERGENGGGG